MDHDLPPPTLVQDARGMEGLMARLESAHEIAVDTEADSFFCYREKVCLIQITADERDFLVDPLARFDVRPLGRVLANPQKLKVFHDGEYDILSLKRDYGFEFKNLFDTRVAAATLGSQAPGLAAVLKDHFEIELDKSMQRSNWGERPLSEKQIRYARLDTHYLLPLMRQQKKALAEQDRMPIVDGECLRLERLSPPDAAFEPDEFVRIKGARLLGPLERQVMRELFILREQMAEASDQPPFRIMNNETLVALAHARPRHLSELSHVTGFSPKQTRRMGDAVLAAVARAVEIGPMRKLPQLENRDGTGGLSDEEIELHERLKQWRKNAANAIGIDSAYLLNRHVMLRVSKEKPDDVEQLRAIDGIQTWQVDRYGGDILRLLADFKRELAAGTLTLARRRSPRRRDD